MRRVTAGVRMQSPRRHREYHLIQTLQVITGTRHSSRYRMTQHLGTLCSLSRLNALGPALREEVNSQRTGTWKNQIDSIHFAPVQQLCGFCCFLGEQGVHIDMSCHRTYFFSSWGRNKQTKKTKKQEVSQASQLMESWSLMEGLAIRCYCLCCRDRACWLTLSCEETLT